MDQDSYPSPSAYGESIDNFVLRFDEVVAEFGYNVLSSDANILYFAWSLISLLFWPWEWITMLLGGWYWKLVLTGTSMISAVNWLDVEARWYP